MRFLILPIPRGIIKGYDYTADTRKVLRAYEYPADTVRQIIAEQEFIADAKRQIAKEFQFNADTTRRIAKEYSYPADAERKILQDYDYAADTFRKVLKEYGYTADAKRMIIKTDAHNADLLRHIVKQYQYTADTMRFVVELGVCVGRYLQGSPGGSSLQRRCFKTSYQRIVYCRYLAACNLPYIQLIITTSIQGTPNKPLSIQGTRIKLGVEQMSLIGNTVRLKAEFKDFNGEHVSPENVNLRIYDGYKNK